MSFGFLKKKRTNNLNWEASKSSENLIQSFSTSASIFEDISSQLQSKDVQG